jgi:cytochrome c oxidase cbb3-type subunit III
LLRSQGSSFGQRDLGAVIGSPQLKNCHLPMWMEFGMSDFFSPFWSWYVAAATLIGIAACLWLLFATSRKRVQARPDNTTGHVWDEDLQELNNPLPRWWMWLFVLTIVFSAGYLALYPGLGAYAGAWRWTSTEQHAKEMREAREAAAPVYAQFADADAIKLSTNAAALEIGQRLFLNNCAQCHGSDGRGAKGFPNLTDADWLYGNAPDAISTTIAKGRVGAMPPLAAAVGTDEDIKNLAHYVLSLSGSPADPLRVIAGKPKFVVCAACHGADRKGNQALGAPNLTDNIWLHGWGENAVAEIIRNGKNNIMPPHEEKFTADQIRILTAYVLSLSRSELAVAR